MTQTEHLPTERLPSRLDGTPACGFIHVEVQDAGCTDGSWLPARFDLIAQVFRPLDSEAEWGITRWRRAPERWAFWYYDQFPYMLGHQIGVRPSTREAKEGYEFIPSYGSMMRARVIIEGPSGGVLKDLLEELRTSLCTAHAAATLDHQTRLRALLKRYGAEAACNFDFDRLEKDGVSMRKES